MKEFWGEILQREGGYLNWKKNGKWIVYKDDSTLGGETEYLNGKYNGKDKTYYDSGEKKGKQKNYYPNGDLKCEIEFVNNEEYGKKYINGRLEFERKFKDWYKWDGKGYDENGNIIYELFNGNSKVK